MSLKNIPENTSKSLKKKEQSIRIIKHHIKMGNLKVNGLKHTIRDSELIFIAEACKTFID